MDIGGTVSYWKLFEAQLRQSQVHVTLLNLERVDTDSDLYSSTAGDARKVSFADNSFDFVHANSVLEHVGVWSDMEDMAREVRRLAPSYFIQVPYFRFPIEPHFRAPLFHWLPETIRARIIKKFALGFHPRARDMNQAMHLAQSACLLDRTQLRALFPDGTICNETVVGFTKSIMAVRRKAPQ